MGKKIWTDEEKLLLKKYFPTTSTNDLVLILNNRYPCKQIRYKAYSMGLQRDENLFIYGHTRRKDILNFSVVDTEEKAYILGFIAADGALVEKKNSSSVLSIKLHKRDLLHLEKIRDIICPSLSIYHTVRDNCCGIRLGDPLLSNELFKHGIIHRKTYNPQIPGTVPDHLIKHWIRGYFDGDGSVYHLKNNYDKIFCHITGYSKSNNNILLDFIHDTFVSHMNREKICDCNPSRSQRKDTVRISYSHNKSICFLQWIYKDATIYLGRKYDKVLPFMSTPPDCKRCGTRGKSYASKKLWTDEEILLLTSNKDMPVDYLLSIIDRSKEAIMRKLRGLK